MCGQVVGVIISMRYSELGTTGLASPLLWCKHNAETCCQFAYGILQLMDSIARLDECCE